MRLLHGHGGHDHCWGRRLCGSCGSIWPALIMLSCDRSSLLLRQSLAEHGMMGNSSTSRHLTRWHMWHRALCLSQCRQL